jgi:hypothetical protein
MNAKTLALVVFGIVLPFATGCGAVATQTTAANTTPKGERRILAEGVELVVSDEAGLEARRIAEEFQAEMRSRYISAR